MVKGVKAGESIRRLRESLGMTQVAFGNHFSVTQSRISEWEGDGPTGPSVEAWMKMADLALRTDPAEALFFWEQTGIDSRFLISLADAMLRTGEPKAERILPAAESILRARLGDEEALKAQGRIVLVPPYVQDEWKDQASLPPLEVPAKFVSNVASTYYVIVEPMGARPTATGLDHWDEIAFDAFGASTRKLGLFLNRRVLINLGAPFTEVLPPHQGGLVTGLRLRMGYLTVHTHGGTTKLLFTSFGGKEIHIDTFSALPNLPGPVQEEIRKGTRYGPLGDVVDRSLEEELDTRLLPSGCDVLGRVVAYYPAPEIGGNDITDAQLRRYRREGK